MWHRNVTFSVYQLITYKAGLLIVHMFTCAVYVSAIHSSVKQIAQWLPKIQQIPCVSDDTAWQGVPWTFALEQFSCCLKTAYCLHILWWTEFITSLETISAPWVRTVLEVLCQPAAAALCDIGLGTVSDPPHPLFNPPPPPCFLPACVAGGEPLRQGHQPVQPLAGRPVQELHRLLLRWAATHRQLPPAQDHRQGKLCQGQAGPPHPDVQGGETQDRGGPGWEEGKKWMCRWWMVKKNWCLQGEERLQFMLLTCHLDQYF